MDFMIEFDPPIGRKDHIITHLTILSSYYLRIPSPERRTFTWEINKPLILERVELEGEFQVRCILKEFTQDMEDYALGKN